MPTLIRLVIFLVVLVALGYGAMFALVAMVEPNEKDVTIRIPARDLIQSPERDPLVRREIDTGRTADSPAPETAEPEPTPEPEVLPDVAPVESAETGEEGSIVTLAPGTE
jgi:hypothetical protein